MARNYPHGTEPDRRPSGGSAPSNNNSGEAQSYPYSSGQDLSRDNGSNRYERPRHARRQSSSAPLASTSRARYSTDSNDDASRGASGATSRKASGSDRRPAGKGAGRASGKHESTAPRYSASRLSRRRGAQGYSRKRQQKQHHGIRNALIVLAIVMGIAVAAVVGYTAFLNGKIQSNDEELLASLKQSSDNEPFYMLLMGVDSDEERASEGDTGRSDSIMLVRIDPVNVKVTMVSIHRDTLVSIEGHGTDKINAAYAYGGKALMVKTVSAFAGVDISHYAEVDFESFTKIVDSIGGVEVTLPTDVYDPDYTGLDLKAGTQTLDGNTALLLCRCRHAYDSYGDGDQYRAANQRMVISAIVKKVLSSDAATMVSAITSMSDSVSTDMSVSSILSLAAKMKSINFDNDVYTAINPTTSEYIQGGWYERSNASEWKAMMERVDAGESPLADGQTDPTAGVAGSVGSGTSSSTSDSSDSGDNSDGSDGSSDSGDGSDSSNAADYTGSVMVLNGAGAPGLATRVSNQLTKVGYTAYAADSGAYGNTTTTVYYNGSANESKAKAVAKELGGSATVKQNDGTYSTSYDIVVVAGEDLEK